MLMRHRAELEAMSKDDIISDYISLQQEYNDEVSARIKMKYAFEALVDYLNNSRGRGY